jgi:hypothetical protein
MVYREPLLPTYFFAPSASHFAIALASLSPSVCGGIGMAPHTPDPPDLILPVR